MQVFEMIDVFVVASTMAFFLLQESHPARRDIDEGDAALDYGASMNPKKFFGVLAAAAGCTLGTVASASTVVMDFEGIGNNAAIGNFYNGGGGTNFGVSFVDALGLIDAPGGTGNFENEPSPDTVMFFTAPSAVMNVAAGFTTALSFKYSNGGLQTASFATIWSGLDGTGTALGTIDIGSLTPCTTPSGTYCNWAVGTKAFAGDAKSVVFAGDAGFFVIDNLTLGSEVPGSSQVPEPTPLLLLGLALTGLAVQRRTMR